MIRPINIRDRQCWRYVTLATAVLLLAAGLRLWRLAELPPGLYYDEAGHLLSAQSIGRAGVFPVYFEFGEGNDPLLAYLARINILILGPVPWAGRLVSAWAGLLSVAATLLAGRLLFARRSVGLLAALLLSSLFWHVNLSRYGIQPMLANALTTACVATFVMAVRGGPRARRSFALGGALVGLGLLTYVAVRLFLIVPVAIVIGALLQTRRPRPLIRGAALAGAVCGLLLLPQVGFFIQNPGWFTERFRVTTSGTFASANPLAALAANAWKVWWGLVGDGPVDQRQNIPGRPALDWLQTAWLIVGGAAIFNTRPQPSKTVALVGLWLFAGLLPAIVTENPPNFQRTVMATTPLALLMGAGVDYLWQRLPAPRLARPALIGLLGVSAVVNTSDYFVRWGKHPDTARAYDAGLYWIAQQLRSAPANAALYETPVGREWLTLEFGLGTEAFQRFRDFNGRACLVMPTSPAGGAVYAVITAEDVKTLPSLQAAYPNGRILAEHFIGGTPYAIIFEVPAGTNIMADVPPARAEYGRLIALRDYHVTDNALQPGDDLQVTLTWELAEATPAALTTFVHVIGPPQADGSTLYAQRDSQPCDNAYPTWQWQPGERLVDTITLPLPAELPAGTYELYAGWYDANSHVRLPLTGPNAGAEAGSGSYRVGTLVVSP